MQCTNNRSTTTHAVTYASFWNKLGGIVGFAQGLLPLQGLGGMGMGNPEQMQQAMSQMMNNPMMQNVLNDPEMLRNMFSSNPAIQQVCAQCYLVTCFQRHLCTILYTIMLRCTMLNAQDSLCIVRPCS